MSRVEKDPGLITGSKVLKVQGSKGFRDPSDKGSQGMLTGAFKGYGVSKIQRLQGPRDKGFQGSKVQGLKG